MQSILAFSFDTCPLSGGPRVAFVGFTKCKRQGREKRLNTAEMGGMDKRPGKVDHVSPLYRLLVSRVHPDQY